MIVPLDKALNILGERTIENRQMLKQARRQRRTEYTDIYGVPFKTEKTEGGNERFRCHLFISTDLEYWERFQFKLRVTSDSQINPNSFKFKIARINDEGTETDPIDISEYLIEQHGEEAWVGADNESDYYPTEDIGDENADSTDFFDVLDATSLMWESGNTSDVHKILDAGTKIITMDANVDCNITFIPYIKYSSLNR